MHARDRVSWNNLLSRLRHVEVNEGIVDSVIEEEEISEDEDEAAQQ